MEAHNHGRWPPKNNEMPDLSALDGKLILNQALNTMFRRAGPSDRLAKALWLNYVRLVDQTLWEYKAARESLQEYVETPNNVISPLFRTIAHLEACINTTWRAIRFARRMRRNKNSPRIDKLPVLSDTVASQIDKLRNAIEHLENKILNGAIAEGEPTTLIAKSDGIELAGIEIFYLELANWIKELHSLAESIIDYREENIAT
jgi:hypothetical protein